MRTNEERLGSAFLSGEPFPYKGRRDPQYRPVYGSGNFFYGQPFEEYPKASGR